MALTQVPPLDLNIFLCDECMTWLPQFVNPEHYNCPVGCFTKITAERDIFRRKMKKSKDKCFVFLTIQDFSRRMTDLEQIQTFIKKINYLYDEGHWVIECGKGENELVFNVHVHMLIKIKTNVKNHKDRINIAWMKYFNTNLYDKDYYLLKQWRKSADMPTYDDWVDEKLTYFNNNLKGNHENTIDLGLYGTFGATQG